jgi:ribosomal protein S27E
VNFGLTCPQCGDNRFVFPESAGDADPVTCADCGHSVGTVEELKQQVERMLNDRRGDPTNL